MSANRFKKSIESATENTKDVTVGVIVGDDGDDMSEDGDDDGIEIIVDGVSEELLREINSKTAKKSGDILEKAIKRGRKGGGWNHTIYLSADVGEALERCAKKSGVSKSGLVNEILRGMLLND